MWRAAATLSARNEAAAAEIQCNVTRRINLRIFASTLTRARAD
jgi:hypothetical protein